jgi:hypothetical protein
VEAAPSEPRSFIAALNSGEKGEKLGKVCVLNPGRSSVGVELLIPLEKLPDVLDPSYVPVELMVLMLVVDPFPKYPDNELSDVVEGANPLRPNFCKSSMACSGDS